MTINSKQMNQQSLSLETDSNTTVMATDMSDEIISYMFNLLIDLLELDRWSLEELSIFRVVNRSLSTDIKYPTRGFIGKQMKFQNAIDCPSAHEIACYKIKKYTDKCCNSVWMHLIWCQAIYDGLPSGAISEIIGVFKDAWLYEELINPSTNYVQFNLKRKIQLNANILPVTTFRLHCDIFENIYKFRVQAKLTADNYNIFIEERATILKQHRDKINIWKQALTRERYASYVRSVTFPKSSATNVSVQLYPMWIKNEWFDAKRDYNNRSNELKQLEYVRKWGVE